MLAAMPLIDLPLPELEIYAGRNPRPGDFDEYWSRALSDLAAVDAKPELVPARVEASFAECFHLYFTGVGGARVHAKYLRPKQRAARGPALLEFHGYTNNSGDFAPKLNWVAAGFAVASLDCRGQGGLSEDVGGVRGTTHSGHIIRGLEDRPEALLFRQIFLDTAELARIVMSFEEVDPDRVGARGASQGGALTLACAALEPRIRRIAPVYPFLSDYQRVWEMDLAKDAYHELGSFFRRHDPTHERVDEWFRRLGYIDVQHLAPRIRAEVMMAIGLMDTVCPPSSQFAAYNKIRSKKTRVVYPDFGHEHLPGWADREWAFFAEL
jgi:cephalosporin-C deacetylase